LTPLQCKIIVAYCTLNHRFAIEIVWCLIIPIFKDNILCYFCSYNVVEIEQLECPLKCPLHSSIKTKFQIITLKLMFNVTYYLELRNAKTVYRASHFLPTMIELVVWIL
jgi:hypothetical protein